MTSRTSRTIALAGLVAVMATPGRAEAQACSSGPLSAYLASAGLGCTIGQLRMDRFSTGLISASAANNIFVDPFTLQGPPGYTWIGFSIRFGSGLALQREVDFSFWSNGAPLYGLLAEQNLIGAPSFFSDLYGDLTGSGGSFQGIDRIDASLARSLLACSQFGSNPAQCQTGTSRQFGTLLPDDDNKYRVDAVNVVAPGGVPYDYTVAVLAENSSVVPEPASIILLSTGLGGIGAMVRRRKRA